MRSAHRYHQAKFLSFTPQLKLKAIHKLILALDQALGDEAERQGLTAHILECLNWMGDSLPMELSELYARLQTSAPVNELNLSLQAYFNSYNLNFADPQIPDLKSDGLRVNDPRAADRASQVIVIADNLRSVFNLGSIFRSAECLGIRTLYLCGTTPTPQNPALDKTARGTAQRANWQYFGTTIEAIAKARALGHRIYALETAAQAESVFEARYRLPLALVLGNEALGIAEDIMAQCDQIVALPVQGWKNSLNVGVAFAVCAYQIVFGAKD